MRKNEWRAVVFNILFGGAFAVSASVAGTAEAQETQATQSKENSPQVQLVQPPSVNQSGPPLTITLQDAVERAKKTTHSFGW